MIGLKDLKNWRRRIGMDTRDSRAIWTVSYVIKSKQREKQQVLTRI